MCFNISVVQLQFSGRIACGKEREPLHRSGSWAWVGGKQRGWVSSKVNASQLAGPVNKEIEKAEIKGKKKVGEKEEVEEEGLNTA
jgi:hypothetical protein